MKRSLKRISAKALGFVVVLVVAVQGAIALAAPQKTALKKSPSAEVMEQSVQHNEAMAHQFRSFETFKGLTSSVRPFADYEKTGYVFLSDEFEFSSRQAKEAIAASLPKDVTLVVFTEDTSSSHVASIKSSFSKHIPLAQLKVIELADSTSGFWARDGLPVPVIDEVSMALGLVDARYYYPFEPDAEVGKMFGATVSSHKFGFEGGNFMANHKGHCIIVNNRSHSRIPDSIFENMYGCKKIERLPHLSGIGHIDEHVRFVSEDTVVTDLTQYQATLVKAGLKVVMMPRPKNDIETYVNSLIVNGVAIVPVFGEKSDAAALKVYTDLGFKAVPAESTELSNDGEGSVHCITMTYPAVPFTSVLEFLGAKELH